LRDLPCSRDTSITNVLRLSRGNAFFLTAKFRCRHTVVPVRRKLSAATSCGSIAPQPTNISASRCGQCIPFCVARTCRCPDQIGWNGPGISRMPNSNVTWPRPQLAVLAIDGRVDAAPARTAEDPAPGCLLDRTTTEAGWANVRSTTPGDGDRLLFTACDRGAVNRRCHGDGPDGAGRRPRPRRSAREIAVVARSRR
jgi:hypothetical protein